MACSASLPIAQIFTFTDKLYKFYVSAAHPLTLLINHSSNRKIASNYTYSYFTDYSARLQLYNYNNTDEDWLYRAASEADMSKPEGIRMQVLQKQPHSTPTQ